MEFSIDGYFYSYFTRDPNEYPNIRAELFRTSGAKVEIRVLKTISSIAARGVSMSRYQCRESYDKKMLKKRLMTKMLRKAELKVAYNLLA